MDYINQLPKEINLLIHARLRAQDLLHLRSTCNNQCNLIDVDSKMREELKHDFYHEKLLGHDGKWITLHSKEVTTELQVLIAIGHTGVSLSISGFKIKPRDYRMRGLQKITFTLPEELHASSISTDFYARRTNYKYRLGITLSETGLSFAMAENWFINLDLEVDSLMIVDPKPKYIHPFQF